MPGSLLMRAARVGLIAFALVHAIGCARPKGLWRDQYAFIGDDGTVLLLALHRQSAGFAEVKGWLGRDGQWQATAYHRFDIPGRSASDRSAVLSSWADAPGAPARAAIDRDGDRVAIDIRLPSTAVRLRASSVVELGRYTDPEGTSVYRAGRAQMADAETVWKGWLIVEETPAGKPLEPFVDYGDFAFVAVASADAGPIVLKRSRQFPRYDQAFSGGAQPRQTANVSLEAAPAAESGGDHLILALPDWDVTARLAIRDRETARGTAPDGSAVVYETLLLGGDYAGIAFVVRPDPARPRR